MGVSAFKFLHDIKSLSEKETSNKKEKIAAEKANKIIKYLIHENPNVNIREVWIRGEKMKIAFISDIHANSYALKVLDDIEKQGISEVICPGDLVGDFIFPNQAINILREILTIQGNLLNYFFSKQYLSPSSYTISKANFAAISLKVL